MNSIKKFISQHAENHLLLFFSLWFGVAIIYLPAYKGGFYEDFLGFLDEYKKLSFLNFLKLTPSSLYYGVNFFHYCFITLFRTNPIPWFLLFTGLHSMNAIIQIRFFKGLFKLWGKEEARLIIITGTMFWLFSPLAAETVNWKACSHYLISMAMMFSILTWLTDYLKSPKRSILIKIILTYAVSTVFLEIFYLTPVFIFIILLTLGYCRKLTRQRFLKTGLLVLGPMVVLWCLYYLTVHYTLGRALAHIDTPFNQLLNPLAIFGKVNKYFVHIYLMEYFLPQNIRQIIYRFLESKPATIATGIGLLLVLIWSMIKLRKLRALQQLSIVLFMLLLASFIIILPMWFFDNFSYLGSRYFYLSGVFGYMLLSSILFSLPGKKVGYYLSGIYLLACVAGTLYIVKNIRDAAKIFNKLMDNFSWGKSGEVLLLDLPTLYRGIGIIGAGDPSNFEYHLDVLKNSKSGGHIYDVSSFNMQGRWDGAHVKVIDSMQLKVSLNQYGTWWWFNGFGASDYENDLFKVTFVDNGAGYLLQLKRKPAPPFIMLYQTGGDWKEVDMAKKGEQW